MGRHPVYQCLSHPAGGAFGSYYDTGYYIADPLSPRYVTWLQRAVVCCHHGDKHGTGSHIAARRVESFYFTKHGQIHCREVSWGVVPFLIIMGIFLLLISLVPSLVTWLPTLMKLVS